jgi:hypothetical protein
MIIDESQFKGKKELYKYLAENRGQLIALKKSTIKHADAIGYDSCNTIVNKQFDYQTNDSDTVIKRAIVGNTYHWLDSHGDVHMDGIFGKSITEKQNDILHLHDHLQQLTAKVGEPEKVFEQKMLWSDLGVMKTGETTALMMLTNIKKDYNSFIFGQYLDKKIQQHSVGMVYVKIMLAINDSEYKDEFAAWNSYIGKVANAEKANELGYFWAVTEAKLIEISAVLKGSNEITPTLEPVKSTPKTEVKEVIDYKYLINNIKI